VEDYLWPRADTSWLAGLSLLPWGEEQAIQSPATEEELVYNELYNFREMARRWHGTSQLPIDQMILSLAQDLFHEPAELAIAHKLAAVLSQSSSEHPEWRLPELTEELAMVARNERRFLGFSDEETGFDPEKYRGKVVVATIHKAKGLEWNRVYLMSANNYDFPSGEPQDSFIAEKWFLRDHLNLDAEALGQLEAAVTNDPYVWYEEGAPTQKARIEYICERLRLLYVGITRARKELIITWNSGRKNDMAPAMPFTVLRTWLEDHKTGIPQAHR
jgi:DNA helicase-2/ATP-dependent DNA helicase PcrA